MTESCACAMEHWGMKLPGTTLSCTEHLLKDRKLRLCNGTEENKAAPLPVQDMSK
jgi:hypothetical protein